MEKLEIEIPVQAGEKVYRTNNRCDIEVGLIRSVRIEAESCIRDTSAYTKEVSPAKDNISIVIYVQWKGYSDTKSYRPDDIGDEVFLSKEELIKYIVGKL